MKRNSLIQASSFPPAHTKSCPLESESVLQIPRIGGESPDTFCANDVNYRNQLRRHLLKRDSTHFSTNNDSCTFPTCSTDKILHFRDKAFLMFFLAVLYSWSSIRHYFSLNWSVRQWLVCCFSCLKYFI